MPAEKSFDRRRLLQFGLAAAVTAAVPKLALAEAPFSREIRKLSLVNLHTGEAFSDVYWEKGQYVPDAVSAADKVLRDFRTGEVSAIDRKLFDLLDDLAAKVESKKPFQIISGYRSPRTNAMLKAKNGSHSGVATKSLHMEGKAMDIRMQDVQLAHVRAAALDMGRGGVGYYPADNFVHVDTGRVRRWG